MATDLGDGSGSPASPTSPTSPGVSSGLAECQFVVMDAKIHELISSNKLVLAL